MSRFVTKFVLLVFVLLGLVGCFGDDYAWNQKLTIVVETPDGIKTGSAVTRVTWNKNHFFKDGGPWWRKVYGESAYVDMDDGKYLFATIGQDTSSIALRSLEPRYPRRGAVGVIYKEFANLKEPLVLVLKHYPTLVTFDDINDPKTVRKVDPYDLDATFGCTQTQRIVAGLTYDSDNIPRDENGLAAVPQCYSFKKITLEITNEPITEGRVEGVLGWLSNYAANGWTLSGEKKIAYHVDDNFAERTTTGVFLLRKRK